MTIWWMLHITRDQRLKTAIPGQISGDWGPRVVGCECIGLPTKAATAWNPATKKTEKKVKDNETLQNQAEYAALSEQIFQEAVQSSTEQDNKMPCKKLPMQPYQKLLAFRRTAKVRFLKAKTTRNLFQLVCTHRACPYGLCFRHWRWSKPHRNRRSVPQFATKYPSALYAGNLKCDRHQPISVWNHYTPSTYGWTAQSRHVRSGGQVCRGFAVSDDINWPIYKVSPPGRKKVNPYRSLPVPILVVHEAGNAADNSHSDVR